MDHPYVSSLVTTNTPTFHTLFARLLLRCYIDLPTRLSSDSTSMTEQSAQPTSAGKKVALGISGGIACYKAAEILRGLQRAGCDVRVAMTKHACEFVQPLTFRALS